MAIKTRKPTSSCFVKEGDKKTAQLRRVIFVVIIGDQQSTCMYNCRPCLWCVLLTKFCLYIEVVTTNVYFAFIAFQNYGDLI